MRAIKHSLVIVVILASGCARDPLQSRAETHSKAVSDDLVEASDLSIVRVAGGTSFVNLDPMSSLDLRRLPPVGANDVMFVDGLAESSRTHGSAIWSRSSLIPTEWDTDVMRLIPTRWDASVIFASQGERQPPNRDN